MSTPSSFGQSPRQLPKALEAKLMAALSAELKPEPTSGRPGLASFRWKGRAAFVGVSAALFGLGLFLFRRKVSPFSVESDVWAQSLVLLGTALVVGVAALSPWPQRTWRPFGLLSLVVLAVAVTHLGSMEFSAFSSGVGCLVWELLGALLPVTVALSSARWKAPRFSRSVVVGCAVGLVPLSVLQLKCPHRDVGHLLLFHLASLMLVVMVTALVRNRLKTQSYVP